MKVLIAGGSGFVGRALVGELESSGHSVTIVTRKPGSHRVYSVGWDSGELTHAVNGHDTVINLSGEPIMGRRWNTDLKQALKESRVGSTKKIVDAMEKSQNKPRCFINASAVGYYGPRSGETLSEADTCGDDFLAKLCEKWEKEALRARKLGIRVAVVRIGIVMGKDGGALSKMLPPFKLGLGGPLGNGEQIMSWIHVGDLARLFLFIMENEKVEGPVNGTAPHPLTNAEFTRTLAGVLRRPAFFSVPGLALKLVLGEVADVLLTGQRALPQKALESGFKFRFSQMEPTLKDLIL